MPLFGKRKDKKPAALPRQLALGRLEDAMGRAEAGQAEYRHVRTAQGRTAHLQQAPPGVLCGWRGPWQPADPSLPVCKLCEVEAEAADMARAAS